MCPTITSWCGSNPNASTDARQALTSLFQRPGRLRDLGRDLVIYGLGRDLADLVLQEYQVEVECPVQLLFNCLNLDPMILCMSRMVGAESPLKSLKNSLAASLAAHTSPKTLAGTFACAGNPGMVRTSYAISSQGSIGTCPELTAADFKSAKRRNSHSSLTPPSAVTCGPPPPEQR